MVAQEPVYTVAEVARILRVSDETIRRKVSSGELGAVEVSSGRRKQYRILYRDLVAWLGPEQARALFGVGEGLREVRAFFERLPESEREVLLQEALAWARARQPEPSETGRTLSPEQIRQRFPQ
ncbi:MAG: helix-turn-helix domain-containing protein [Thermaceae bacterium]|nr:helix-turn-helix domain-containing protein [Thermaceae bacterium]